jgi:hypothetical protein
MKPAEERHPHATGHPTDDPDRIVRQRRINFIGERFAQLQRERTRASLRRASVMEAIVVAVALTVPLMTAVSVYVPVCVTAVISVGMLITIHRLLLRFLPSQPPLPCKRCLAALPPLASFCVQCGNEQDADQRRSWGRNQVDLLTLHVAVVLASGVITFRIGLVVRWAVFDFPLLSTISTVTTLVFSVGLLGLTAWKQVSTEQAVAQDSRRLGARDESSP